MYEDGYPIAWVKKITIGRNNTRLIYAKCPYCGGVHQHGGGKADRGDAVEAYFGHRAAHCAGRTNKGYIIKQVEDDSE